MSIIIDLIALAIILVCIILGYSKGFIKSVMGLISLIVAIAVATYFQAFAANIIKSEIIEPYFVNKTADTFTSLMNGGSEIIEPEQIFEDRPTDLVDTTEGYGFSVDDLKDFYENNIKGIFESDDIKGISEKLSEFLVENSVDTVSNVLGFTAVFIVALIALAIIQLVLNLIFKLPILKTANKLLGAVFGILKGVLFVVILINLTFALCKTDALNDSALDSEAVSSSITYSITESLGLIF